MERKQFNKLLQKVKQQRHHQEDMQMKKKPMKCGAMPTSGASRRVVTRFSVYALVSAFSDQSWLFEHEPIIH